MVLFKLMVFIRREDLSGMIHWVKGYDDRKFSFNEFTCPHKNGFIEGVVGVVQNLQASEVINL